MRVNKSPSPIKQLVPKPVELPTIETLPQIELNLPKRPVRERLGVREEPKKHVEKPKEKEKSVSPERLVRHLINKCRCGIQN
jgi:hypothetical protein